MIGTTTEESFHEDRKVFRLRLFTEYEEDKEIIAALDNILTEPVIKGKNKAIQLGFYKKIEKDGSVTLLLVRK